MKKFTKLLGIVLIIALVMSMGTAAFAAATDNGDYPNPGDGKTVNTHTITITNTDQNVSHNYVAYKVFGGNLDAKEEKLADIMWGAGVNPVGIITALQNTTDSQLVDVQAAVASVNTNDADAVAAAARKVAEAISKFTSTDGANQSAGAIDAFASIIGANLVANKPAGSFTEGTGDKATTYTAEVLGDGYYFIKDETATSALNNDDTHYSDTLAKYMMMVIKDSTIVAKDTHLTPDKKILKDQGLATEERLAANSAAMGDVVTFEVKIPVPNTVKYIKDFVFHMNDKLPEGLTFLKLDSVEVYSKTVTDLKGATPLATVPEVNYELTVKTGTEDFTVLTGEDAADKAVATTGGQTVKIVFKDFKDYVETDRDPVAEGAQNLIGETLVIRYKAVVNQKASFKPTGNENEVTFDYSNDPNNVYDGDDFDNDDPHGVTPESKTQTYVTKLKVLKVDSEKKALAGATFELSGEALNYVLETGEKYEEKGYTVKEGETIEAGTYWKLVDETYTSTPPTTPNINTTQYAKDGDAFIECVKVSFTRVLMKHDEKTTEQGKKLLLTVTSDKAGNIIFEGLNAGTYKLKEIKAPDGYNLDTNVYTLVIDWTDPAKLAAENPAKANGGFSIGTDSSKTADNKDMFTIGVVGGDVTTSTTIVNQSGTTLPSTGGIGTTIFYVVGSILVVAAGVLLVTKKRMSREG